MAKSRARRSSPSTRGTLAGNQAPACRSQAASAALRSTVTSQTAATFRRESARLTQKRRSATSTRTMSDETPPVSGVKAGVSPSRNRRRRCSAAIRASFATTLPGSPTMRSRDAQYMSRSGRTSRRIVVAISSIDLCVDDSQPMPSRRIIASASLTS